MQPLVMTCQGISSQSSGSTSPTGSSTLPVLCSIWLEDIRIPGKPLKDLLLDAIAMLFSHFNSVLGVLVGLNFWPITTLYFPIEMYLRQKKVMGLDSPATIHLVTVMGFIGSLEELIIAKVMNHSIQFNCSIWPVALLVFV
ncbi:hypothetical protein SAY87_005041 [Trapa incisa]|uniref:Uncharacterized protein n=1 Tax=Trapa incisa TaxID=236973 RepID=A0AAN7JPS0_9MYRT|nr:hypothetical protein SAY87_005041 [Trapa incisa]